MNIYLFKVPDSLLIDVISDFGSGEYELHDVSAHIVNFLRLQSLKDLLGVTMQVSITL